MAESNIFANTFLDVWLKRTFDETIIPNVKEKLNSFDPNRLTETINECFKGIGHDHFSTILSEYFYIILTEDYSINGIEYVDVCSDGEVSIYFTEDINEQDMKKFKHFYDSYRPFYIDVEGHEYLIEE